MHEPDITKKEMHRESAVGEKVFSRVWLCESPRAIVQIAHGMSEHSARYDEFASMLCRQGYCVYANDHPGHGSSANGHLGTFTLEGDGFEAAQENMRSLFELARAENGNLPLVLIGHSMGSVLSRLYADKWGADLAALAVLGPPSSNPFLGFGLFVAERVAAKKGRTARSTFLEKLTGSTQGLSGDALEKKEMWLSRDIQAVRGFIDDELCGFDFSASGYADLFRGVRTLEAKSWGKSIPDIPILIAGGGQDSAGGNGKAPDRCAKRLRRTGHTMVTLKIFPEDRHELLNELDKEQVYDFILDWIETVLNVQPGVRAEIRQRVE